jgi:hypothetical protein
VDIGTAGDFSVLASASITTEIGPGSHITGDVGIGGANGGATNFGFVVDPGGGQFATSSKIDGEFFAFVSFVRLCICLCVWHV